MSDGAATVIRHVVIRGRVQGVGYRAWTEEIAHQNRLEGWVRNRRDGTVEAVFVGPAAAVTTVIEACRQGPLGARVDDIYIYELSVEAEALALRRPGERFSLLATA